MVTDVEDFFTKGCGRFSAPDCSTRPWARGLADLRRLGRQAGRVETVKWARLCYLHAGCHIAILGVVRSDVRLGFFHAALLTDPEGILERQGPNTRHPDMIGFRDDGDVRNKKPVIVATLREAMGYAEQGLEPPPEVGSPNLPDEAIEALDAAPSWPRPFTASPRAGRGATSSPSARPRHPSLERRGS